MEVRQTRLLPGPEPSRKPAAPRVHGRIAHGGLQDLPDDDDFLVDRVARRRLVPPVDRFFIPVYAVFLSKAGSDLRKALVPHEGRDVVVEAPAMGADIDFAALPFGRQAVGSTVPG